MLIKLVKVNLILKIFLSMFFLKNVELFWELIFNIMNINFWRKKIYSLNNKMFEKKN